ncbi:MAG: hypothetical protein P8X57_06675 [Cyclobacteriaceae bacterium]
MKFKALLLSLLIASIFTLDIQAQKKWGPRLGWTSATTSNDGDRIQGSVGSLFVGIQRKGKIFGPVKLLTGAEYVQNGHRRNGDNYRKIHYLSFPIGVNVDVGPIFADAGFGLKFKLAESYYVDGNKQDSETDFLDIPFFIGAGARVAIFTIDARYHWGLLDVNNGNHNNYFQLGVGMYLF